MDKQKELTPEAEPVGASATAPVGAPAPAGPTPSAGSMSPAENNSAAKAAAVSLGDIYNAEFEDLFSSQSESDHEPNAAPELVLSIDAWTAEDEQQVKALHEEWFPVRVPQSYRMRSLIPPYNPPYAKRTE
jgi:hypothetical protein